LLKDFGNDICLETRLEGKRRSVSHTSTDSPLPRFAVYRENVAIRTVHRDNCDRFSTPYRVLFEKELKRKLREVNAGQSGHGR